MTRSSVFILIIIFLLSSCNEKEKVQREVSYYPNGSLKYEVKLINGKREGWGISYFENGKIEGKSLWKDGKMNGEKVIYYENGNVRQISQYKEGICLSARDFTEKGLLNQVTVFDSLKRILDYYNYNEDGTRDFRPGTKRAIFIADNDTVNLGEVYQTEVRLGNRQFKEVDVIVGDITDRKLIKRNPPLPKKADSITSILTIKPDSVGLNKVEGVIFERTGDSMDVIQFRHYFYVKEN